MSRFPTYCYPDRSGDVWAYQFSPYVWVVITRDVAPVYSYNIKDFKKDIERVKLSGVNFPDYEIVIKLIDSNIPA